MSIQLPEGTKYEYLTLGMNAFRHKHTETEFCATLRTLKVMPPVWQNWGCPSNSQTHELPNLTPDLKMPTHHQAQATYHCSPSAQLYLLPQPQLGHESISLDKLGAILGLKSLSSS